MTWSPDFIGIGAMRSATTWLARCIESHSQLYIPIGLKEIHFFDEFKKQISHGEKRRWNYEKGLEWYENYFHSAKRNQKVGEYTPNYLSDEQSPALIAKHYPEVKLIVSLRDPIDRAYSHYQFVKRNHENIPESFSVAIEKLNDVFQFLELGLYGKYLNRYFDHFPKHQILILFYENIESTPEKTCKSLYSFLRVDDSYRPAIIRERINISDSVKSEQIYSLLRGLKKTVKKRSLLRKSVSIVGGFKLGRWITKRNIDSEKKGGNVIGDTTREFLKTYYLDDIKHLENLIDIDLTSWKS